jgi:predicted PurR-regulated permease PerM
MNEDQPASPNWSPTTKLVVGLTAVAIVAALLIRFRNIIGPLILAFMLAYLLYPLAGRLSEKIKVTWRSAVNLIYLVLSILVLASFTATGVAIVGQLQSLVGFIQRSITNLPAIVAEYSHRVFELGPFRFDLGQYDLQTLVNQLLSFVQPILGRAGIIISSLATGAAVTIGWGLFVLLISYFLLADANRVSDEMVHIDLPGYSADLQRLSAELGKIWNAFLRGQLILTLLIAVSYASLLGILGMRFALGIAILAGFGRLVPYIGPMVLWIVTALVAYFQGGNYFGLDPLAYAILVLACALVLDQLFDNLIAPRLMGQTLGVHPAAVLVTAIIAAQLIGLIGLLLAAPAVATLKLLTDYLTRKMFDLDPWPEEEFDRRATELPWVKAIANLRDWWNRIRPKAPKKS